MDSTELVKLVEAGDISPAEIEKLAEKVRLGMSVEIAHSLDRLRAAAEKAAVAQEKVMDKLVELVDTNWDVMETKEKLSVASTINGIILNVAEIQRKIFNGKDLIVPNPLSEEEKKMLALLKELDTEEKKESFVNALKTTLKNKKEATLKKPKGLPVEDDDDFTDDPDDEEYFEDDAPFTVSAPYPKKGKKYESARGSVLEDDDEV